MRRAIPVPLTLLLLGGCSYFESKYSAPPPTDQTRTITCVARPLTQGCPRASTRATLGVSDWRLLWSGGHDGEQAGPLLAISSTSQIRLRYALTGQVAYFKLMLSHACWDDTHRLLYDGSSRTPAGRRWR